MKVSQFLPAAVDNNLISSKNHFISTCSHHHEVESALTAIDIAIATVIAIHMDAPSDACPVISC